MLVKFLEDITFDLWFSLSKKTRTYTALFYVMYYVRSVIFFPDTYGQSFAVFYSYLKLKTVPQFTKCTVQCIILPYCTVYCVALLLSESFFCIVQCIIFLYCSVHHVDVLFNASCCWTVQWIRSLYYTVHQPLSDVQIKFFPAMLCSIAKVC